MVASDKFKVCWAGYLKKCCSKLNKDGGFYDKITGN